MYSFNIFTLVRPKVVYCHLCMRELLQFISDFTACIVIWGLMKKATICSIAQYLFYDLSPLCRSRSRSVHHL